MSFKPFYIHSHHKPGKISSRYSRGFTSLVKPDPSNDKLATIQTAFCSHKDQFCKRIGREVANAAPAYSLLRRQISNELEINAEECDLNESFDYVNKYML